MDRAAAEKRHEELVRQIERSNHLYYDLDAPELSDYEYDALTREARALEAQYPEDPRPRQAPALAAAWAAGEVKMALPRRAILDLHAMAKALSDPADAARCHAVAQACSAVHTEAHAIGLAVYELTAIARESPPETCTDALDARIAAYEAALPRCRVNVSGRPWAAFLRRSAGPNAEARRAGQ